MKGNSSNKMKTTNEVKDDIKQTNISGPSLETAWDSHDGPPIRQVTALVIGCGQRGQNYAAFAQDFPSRLKIVGVAEKHYHRRNKMKETYGLDGRYVVEDWRELTGPGTEKVADAVFICTQDQEHRDPAVAFAGMGYHILLEKPMAVSAEDCLAITMACEDAGVMLAVCHVMRYFPPCVKIKEIIDRGVIGEVVTINHTENVGYWHFAHSFVRGNWRREDSSTFSLMAKCCHDMDLLTYWMGDTKVEAIQSFGSLKHFKESNQPAGAADHCLQCPVEAKCPYSVQKIYLANPVNEWPNSVVCDIEDDPRGYPAKLRESLESSDYGKCVYKCDNDVCDNQTVNLQFRGGAIANLTMTAFTKQICQRMTRITGTRGEITWDGGSNGPIIFYDFLTKKEESVSPDLVAPMARTRGHGGADFFLINSFTTAVASNDPSHIKSGPAVSRDSHLLVFAAEKSRKEKKVVCDL